MSKQAFLQELHLQYRHLPGYIWNVIDKLPMASVIAIADAIGGSILFGRLTSIEKASALGSLTAHETVYQELQEDRLRQ